MSAETTSQRRVGVAIVGLGGAVATTAVAGVELLRAGEISGEGLPLAALDEALVGQLATCENLVFDGWDLCGDDLFAAARTHNVLTESQLAKVANKLRNVRPRPAFGSQAYCRNIAGENCLVLDSHLARVERLRGDLRRFRTEQELDGLVMINLASTERAVTRSLPLYSSLAAFENALAANAPEISPAMIYAYAAIAEQVPFANFTPSVACDLPALVEFAERRGVPLAGKDGKTGQTMLKTVLAPALRARNLRVAGWYSANILGNRDGQALDDADSLRSKLETKGGVLDQMLGYRVEDHIVDIRYYRPRGDNKEAWDNIDVTGFLGQPMQIKINFLCKDSILAAPLIIELARLLDLAARRGEGGVQEHLGVFFKSPMTAQLDGVPEHALLVQQERLIAWLADAAATADGQATTLATVNGAARNNPAFAETAKIKAPASDGNGHGTHADVEQLLPTLAGTTGV